MESSESMNLPNKITIGRIIMAIIMIFLFLTPDGSLGFTWPKYLVNDEAISLQYIIGGILFVIAALTDFIDGKLARKNNMVTDFGKVADAIADKVLVNGLLIVLACNGDLSPVVPVVIIIRDTIVDSLKMISGNKGKVVAASWLGKAKTMCMMVGLTLLVFKNIPFCFIGIPVDQFLIIVATILSVVSGCEYYYNTREFLFPEKGSKK